MMTREKAIELLPEFICGDLLPAQHKEIAALLETDSELHWAFEQEKLLNGMLRTQSWVHASSDFTTRVFEKAGLPLLNGDLAVDRVLGQLSTYAPIGTLILVGVLYGRPIATRLWDLWRGALGWLGGTLGVESLQTSTTFAVTALALVAIGALVTFDFFVRRDHSSA
jgi:hypothetical protein